MLYGLTGAIGMAVQWLVALELKKEPESAQPPITEGLIPVLEHQIPCLKNAAANYAQV